MRISRSLSELTDLSCPLSIALGMFDGLHLGHHAVLEQAVQQAKNHQLTPAVLSFSTHPKAYFTGQSPAVLCSQAEREAAFKTMGFEFAILPPFDESVATLSAEAFVQDLLVRQLNTRHVVVGHDFCYGQGRAGTPKTLHERGAVLGFRVDCVPVVQCLAGQAISSTRIREVLKTGPLAEVNALLGRLFSVTGVVEQGKQQGEKLGFPTANVRLIPDHRALPKVGVYAGWATVQNKRYPAVMNVGFAPTLHGDTFAKPRLEVHCLDYPGACLYDESIQVEFAHHLRDEQRFDSLDALVQQIQADVHQASALLRATTLA